MRRTMISLRGFQPPRPSGEGRSSLQASKDSAPKPAPAASAAKATEAVAPGQQVRRPSAKAAKPRSGSVSSHSGGHPQPLPDTRRSSATLSAVAALGGHFSANRRLMQQAKVTRREPADAAVQDTTPSRTADSQHDAELLASPPPDSPPASQRAREGSLQPSHHDWQAGAPSFTAALRMRNGDAPEVAISPSSVGCAHSPSETGGGGDGQLQLPLSCHKRPRGELDGGGEDNDDDEWPQEKRQVEREQHGNGLDSDHSFSAHTGSPSLTPQRLAPISASTAARTSAAAPATGAGVGNSHFLLAFEQVQEQLRGASPLPGEGNSSEGSTPPQCMAGGPPPPQAPLLREETERHDDEETDEALAREVEEDLRLSEDLPFTPHRLTAGVDGSDVGSAPASQASAHHHLPTLSFNGTAAARCSSSLPTLPNLVAPPFADAQWTTGLGSASPLPTATAAAVGAEERSNSGPPMDRKKRTVFMLTSVSPTAHGSAVLGAPSPLEPAPQSLSLPPSPLVQPRTEAIGEEDEESPPPPPLQLFLPSASAAANGDGGTVHKRTCFTLTSGAVPSMPPAPPCTEDAVVPVASLATTPPPPPVSPQPFEDGSWYDLPHTVGLLFAAHRGVKMLYDWQDNLLQREDIRRGGNFVYSMPTSGGKTLVAEISLLRCVLNRRRSAFFVVPFVSLAEEKTFALRQFGEALDFAVEGHYGSTGRFPLPPSPSLFVCTIEKANSLLNHLLEEGRGGELGAVVVDELHMLGEPRRGATLELFLSKLLLLSERQQALQAEETDPIAAAAARLPPTPARLSPLTSSGAPPAGVQLIGMSATIPNLASIARWLGAALYEGSERPVPLRQYSVVDGLVLRDGETNERNLNGKTEVDHLFELAYEVPEASVLVFCASRQQCVDTAKGLVLYAKRTAAANSPGLALTTAADQLRTQSEVSFAADGMGDLKPNTSAGVRALVDELQGLGSNSEAVLLTELVQFGVAFHHGGLLAEEREVVEAAYRRRLIRILCCTSTLAAGVNLPARRVVFKTPYIGREFLTKSRYLQMCGRAGRAGLDAYGESFLILTRRDRNRGHQLMRQEIEPCLSQLLEEASNLPRALLECVTVGLAQSQASAVVGWGGRLLAGIAPGPIDLAFEDALSAHYGPLYASERAGESGGGLAPSDTAGNGDDGLGSLTANRPPLPSLDSGVSTSCASPPSSSTDAAGDVTSRVLRRAAYVAAVRSTKPCSETLEVLLRHSLSVLGDAGLVSVATEPSSSPSVDPAHDGRDTTTTTSGDGAAGAVAEPTLPVRPTPFGASAVRSCFSVEEALLVRGELENLQLTGLILGDDLHLCYFLTPLREVGDCDWQAYAYRYSHLTDRQQRIANMLGVDEQFIAMRAMGLGGGRNAHDVPATVQGKKDFFTARRFYVALMLSEVLSEVPMEEVESRYCVRRGQLQNLMRSASMFSSSITSFCHAMEWYSLEAVLASFVKRLGFGVKPDLVPLMEIRNVQPGRARALWNAGYKSPKHIAACEDPDEMVRKVKSSNAADCKTARFFTRRSALALIREASTLLEYQIMEKKNELQLLIGKRG